MNVQYLMMQALYHGGLSMVYKWQDVEALMAQKIAIIEKYEARRPLTAKQNAELKAAVDMLQMFDQFVQKFGL